MRSFRILAVAGLAAAALAGQTPEPQFEVASVKTALPGRPQGVWTDGSPVRIRMQRLTLKQLIASAYEMRGYQVFGPGWMDTERYDINAKLPDEAAKLGENERWRQIAAMERSLLAERFQLAVHRETRDLPVYALVAAKEGLKIRKTGEDEHENVKIDSRLGHLAAQQMPLRQLVAILTQLVHHPVIDATGFEGVTDIKLDWTPDEDGSNPLPNALHEQLGLKLEERKTPTEVIVVDRVDRPPEN